MGKTAEEVKGLFFRPVVDGTQYILDQGKEAAGGVAKAINKTAVMQDCKKIIAHYKK